VAEKHSGAVKREFRLREFEFSDTPGEFEDAGHQFHFSRVRRVEKCLLRQHYVAVKDTVGLKVEVPAHA
jgi:hypothetical protein